MPHGETHKILKTLWIVEVNELELIAKKLQKGRIL